MEDFTDLERAVLAAILAEEPERNILQRQIECAAVKSRKNTGHGFFTHIAVDAAAPRASAGSPLDTNVHARVPGIEHDLGFLLFLEDGKANMLEGFTYGEDIRDQDLATLTFEVFKADVSRT